MTNIANTEKRQFAERDQSDISQNVDGYLQTKTLADMWTMLGQNLGIAQNSDRTDVAEGVIESMCRSLTARQRMWQSLVETEKAKYAVPGSSTEGSNEFQEWLIAMANDQIICIDEGEEPPNQTPSFLGNFERDVTPLVSAAYLPTLTEQINGLKDSYVDVATEFIQAWCQMIFYIDFRDTLKNLFTADWYGSRDIEQMVITFADYMSDYGEAVHRAIFELLVMSLADQLLIHYLSAIRNKGAKFKRQDPFTDKIKDDCFTVFKFFEQYECGPEVKEKWRVIQDFVALLSVEKAQVPQVYVNFKSTYPDLHIGWVEAVLRARDDFERSMLNAVKAKAAEMSVDPAQQYETIMSQVK